MKKVGAICSGSFLFTALCNAILARLALFLIDLSTFTLSLILGHLARSFAYSFLLRS